MSDRFVFLREVMRPRRLLVVLLVCFGWLSGVMAGQPLVSRLEAVHVAEIHSGGVVQSVNLTQFKDQHLYSIEVLKGDVQQRVVVSGDHGRLMSIKALRDQHWESLYVWPGVRVVAHRGGALLGQPENTLAAIQRAIEVGADMIEVDIRQTKDGHLVLMHDATVDRTTNGSGRVDEMTLAAFQQLEIAGVEGMIMHPPTLREALELMRGRIDSDLDYKAGDLERLLSLVRELDMVKQSTMYGSWDRLRNLGRLEPALRIRPTADYPAQIPQVARELRPAMINMDWHAVTEAGIRSAHVQGCHAFVNCLAGADVDQYIDWAIDAGADYIQSDRPDVVIKMLKDKGLYRTGETLGDALETPLRASRLVYPFR